MKCRSTFVRRDLLLRHDRTVHAKDGGVPLQSEGRKRSGTKGSPTTAGSSKPSINIDPGTLEQIEASSDGMLDLETAAMLMTDFQHKAAAAANGHLHDTDGSIPNYSPDRASYIEPSVDYLASSLPQMPWDAFMSQAPSEPKAHSMTSSMSSQDTHLSQQPYVHMGSIQPHQSQLPPIMERQGSLNTLAPSFPSLTDTFPVSGSPTPNALSPFPSMTGPVSPVNYRRSPGPSQALTMPKAPQLSSEDERILISDKIGDSISLPSTESINLHLSTYFNLFHHHLPFLHPATFTPSTAESALLLAVLSIGALYNFDQEQAYVLHHGSRRLVNEFLQNKDNFDSRKCPLWTMQSTLLNMLFESWSGGPQGLEWACSIKSLLANVGVPTQIEFHGLT
jgi:Fungal specific transcription factor domain